jgi:dGTPase
MINIWEQRKSNATSGVWRNPYSRDRARIIHSAFFRRLQGKTQVLGLGESDFYRTRLTHSIEVAQISSGIVEYLQYKFKDAVPVDLYPSTQLIEAISLAHDIGHPPFGHGGEVALNYMMRDHGGFEGNAQTLRIAASLGESSENDGLNLTRRTLLGLIKYPYYYGNMVCKDAYVVEQAPLNISSFKPPKCIFDCDKEAFNFVCEPFSENDKLTFITPITSQENKHKKPNHKSFDTSIMELADDIAYGVHDLEDAIALKLVTQKQWEKSVVAKISDPSGNYPFPEDILIISSELFSEENGVRKKAVGKLVNFFVENCKIKKKNIFSHDLLDYNSCIDSDAQRTLEILKEFVVINVIKTPEVQTLEYKGQQMIIRLFEALKANPKTLLHQKYYTKYNDSGENVRFICDYIAGTTDDYATRLYHKIFTPSSGSLFDWV